MQIPLVQSHLTTRQQLSDIVWIGDEPAPSQVVVPGNPGITFAVGWYQYDSPYKGGDGHSDSRMCAMMSSRFILFAALQARNIVGGSSTPTPCVTKDKVHRRSHIAQSGSPMILGAREFCECV